MNYCFYLLIQDRWIFAAFVALGSGVAFLLALIQAFHPLRISGCNCQIENDHFEVDVTHCMYVTPLASGKLREYMTTFIGEFFSKDEHGHLSENYNAPRFKELVTTIERGLVGSVVRTYNRRLSRPLS